MKLSNNNLKLSFLKDPKAPDLIFLATFDEDSDLTSVQRFLNKISDLFSKKFDSNQISNWNGKLDSFKSFEDIIEKCVNENETITQTQHVTKAFDWLTSFETDDSVELSKDTEENSPNPEYYDFVPCFVGSNSKIINPKNYLTGDTSVKIYDVIDGRKSIKEITREISIEQIIVYNVCKNLVKMGFLSLN